MYTQKKIDDEIINKLINQYYTFKKNSQNIQRSRFQQHRFAYIVDAQQ